MRTIKLASVSNEDGSTYRKNYIKKVDITDSVLDERNGHFFAICWDKGIKSNPIFVCLWCRVECPNMYWQPSKEPPFIIPECSKYRVKE